MKRTTLDIITIIQAISLSAYGFFAILLHRSMMSYDIFSVSNSGAPVHLCYLVTMVCGLFLLIRGFIKDRKMPGFFKSKGFVIPAAVTAVCLIFSQANTVYTTTNGGSIGGLISYFFRALLSGSDPIDSFVYGSLTIPKYIFVAFVGIAAAILTLLWKPVYASFGAPVVNMDGFRNGAASFAEGGSRMINKASAVAGAAYHAARNTASTYDQNAQYRNR